MDKAKSSRVRRLKKSLPEEKKLRVKIFLLKKHIRELEEKLEGGWVSPDGTYCDTRYAARCLNKSVSRLRNMKSEGVGPRFFDKSGSVYYRIEDLKAYIEEGRSMRNHNNT